MRTEDERKNSEEKDDTVQREKKVSRHPWDYKRGGRKRKTGMKRRTRNMKRQKE